MPNFNIIKKIEFKKSFRNQSIIDKYDLKEENFLERFSGSIDIEDKEWTIGLIYGDSGTGKTTIAKQLFGDSIILNYNFSQEHSVLDAMPKEKSLDEISQTFNQVGFSSPPSWLKPFHVLSNGEKMRVELAYNLLIEKNIICFDEFTSVVDRDVAKTMSMCLEKIIRKLNKKIIVISCHKDILEYLSPDWNFCTDDMSFFLQKISPKDQSWNCQYTNAQRNIGKSLGSIII